MPYNSLSLFLLLGSSMAMAMEIPGTGQASALGQTIPGTCNTLAELKKLFPKNRIYLVTDRDTAKDYSIFAFLEPKLSPKQIERLKNIFGQVVFVRFHPATFTENDISIIKKKNKDTKHFFLVGALVPNTRYVIIVERLFAEPGDWLNSESVNEPTID